METNISKAQQKRNKDLRNRIESMIKRNLMDFQDRYLCDYADYQERQLQNAVNRQQILLDDPEQLKRFNDSAREQRNGRFFYEITLKDIQGRLANAKKQLNFPTTRKMEYFNEAKKSYDAKIEKMITTVCGYNPDTRWIKIERVSDVGHEFSFLISNNDMEIHARVIYACGDINAPHYRFIVTKRNK